MKVIARSMVSDHLLPATLTPSPISLFCYTGRIPFRLLGKSVIARGDAQHFLFRVAV
jgi:hypothetical protein